MEKGWGKRGSRETFADIQGSSGLGGGGDEGE